MNNEINNLFAAAVMTKSNHPGYMVLIRDRNGVERELGPYSRPIARMVAEDHSCFPMVAIEDMETGELIWTK